MKEEGGTLLGDKGVRRHQVSATRNPVQAHNNIRYLQLIAEYST